MMFLMIIICLILGGLAYSVGKEYYNYKHNLYDLRRTETFRREDC